MNSTELPHKHWGFGGDIWSQFERLQQELQEEIGRWGSSPKARSRLLGRRTPAVNIWISKDSALLTAEIPGLSDDQIAIEVQGQIATLRSAAQTSDAESAYKCIRSERNQAGFERSFELPFEIDPNKVKARYERGILTLQLPRTEETKPRKIQVTSAN